MRFVTLVFAALAAGPLAALAAPAPADDASNAAECPSGENIHCGDCNGTSCQIGFENFSCDEGSCTAQSGGGDGTPCWDSNYNGEPNIVCPGKA
ncbi:hypothetical protein AbraIFM66951_000302 [Aspergillus brasiliensis]|nr:hypothetical protein AbraIFM66951_000302 [Aspergillus brasiliensis]